MFNSGAFDHASSKAGSCRRLLYPSYYVNASLNDRFLELVLKTVAPVSLTPVGLRAFLEWGGNECQNNHRSTVATKRLVLSPACIRRF
jgi:hypothetical protein